MSDDTQTSPIASLKRVLAGISDGITQIKAAMLTHADASARRDAAIAAEAARHTGLLAQIDAEFAQATAGLPIDPATIEPEYQDLLAQYKAAFEALPPTLLPAPAAEQTAAPVDTVTDPAAQPAT